MEDNIKYIFETKDVLGNEVKLKSNTWEYHVIGEHLERHHFSGKEAFFKQVIEDPDYIFKQNAKSGKTRYNYLAFDNIKDEGNPKIYSVIAEETDAHRDIVTILEKSDSRLKEEERKKEAKIYDRRRQSKGELR